MAIKARKEDFGSTVFNRLARVCRLFSKTAIQLALIPRVALSSDGGVRQTLLTRPEQVAQIVYPPELIAELKHGNKQYLKITDDAGLSTDFDKVGSWSVTR
jgi:hypothetical protein